MNYPEDMVGRRTEWARLHEFTRSGEESASLGIVWGRRRVGKSFLLQTVVEQTGGFYYAAVRGSSAESLRELGEQIGAYQGTAAPLALGSWGEAIEALLALGRDREITVVLDEYPYLLEHTPALDSIIQRAFGPRSPERLKSRVRLILCGSAMAVMGRILSGTAPLRGRAGMDMRISPFDFRLARELHGMSDVRTAMRLYSVIGGVAAYAREMVGGDLPSDADDFDRWITERVLSPAAPLFGEVPMLLSEDPATARARKVNLYHAALAGVALGNHAHRKLTSYVKIPGASLAPIVDALVSAELVDRVQDPIRENRPTYHVADPMIRFHYAVIRRHQAQLARHGVDIAREWRRLQPTFDSQVVGPCFEVLARYWTAHFADHDLLGGCPDHVGPSVVMQGDGAVLQLDVVVAAADSDIPSERTILVLGEAKAGERLTMRHLQRLESARAAFAGRASNARLLLFGVEFAPELVVASSGRADVHLIDLPGMYALQP